MKLQNTQKYQKLFLICTHKAHHIFKIQLFCINFQFLNFLSGIRIFQWNVCVAPIRHIKGRYDLKKSIMLKFGMNSGHKARTLRRTTWKVHTTNYQHRLHQLIVKLMRPTLPFPAWFLVRRQWRLSSFNVTNDISHVKKVVSLCEKTDTAQLGGFGDSFAAFEVFLASFTLPCVVKLLPPCSHTLQATRTQ